MVLLVLAIIWAALLISWFRSRAVDTTNADTVGMFRRHLTVLGKATPATAYGVSRHQQRSPDRYGRAVGASRPGQPLRSGVQAARPPRPSGFQTMGAPRGGYRTPSAQQALLRRRQAQRRRRDILFALLAGVAGSFALALIPGLKIMWSVQIIFDILFVAYIGLLMRVRNRAAERDLKLRFLPQAQPHLRPVTQYEFAGAGGYEYDYDYGDGAYEYDLRQAIN